MNLLNRLIEQAKKPSGILGVIMISIMNTAHSKMTKWGLSLLNIERNESILDIGCGGGVTLKHLSRLATDGEIIGIDYSHDAVKKSIQVNNKEVIRGVITVEHGNVEKMQFDNESFDTITAIQTHYFWSDMKSAIGEIHRVLKKDGQVMILAENFKMKYHMSSYETGSKLMKLMSEIGFSELKIREKNGWMCLTGCCSL